MPEPYKKYRIKDYLDRLPKGRYSEAIDELAQICGITPNHLRKIANYTIEDNNEAKPSHLYFIAEYFGVTIDDLLNKQCFEKKRIQSVKNEIFDLVQNAVAAGA